MKTTSKVLVFAAMSASALLPTSISAYAQACEGPFSIVVTNPRSLTDEDDAKIHDHDRFALVAALRDKGVNVNSIEAWGSQIKVDIVDDDCSVYTEFFDPDSLEPSLAAWR
jgi:hypothetical protein